jgi:hypothetical protein
MKGGINIWRALRDTHSMHAAWQHVAGRPYCDEDLPRRINEKKDATMREHMRHAEREAVTDGSNRIARAIEVQAIAESQELGGVAL